MSSYSSVVLNFTNVTSDLVADTGLHLHALIVFLLRLLLLLLLRGVIRGGLSLPQRLLQVLGSLVGLAIVVHRHLRAALVGRSNLLCIVRVRVVAVPASLKGLVKARTALLGFSP